MSLCPGKNWNRTLAPSTLTAYGISGVLWQGDLVELKAFVGMKIGMQRFGLLASFAFLFMSLASRPVFAGTYQVSGIEVEASATDAVVAKNQALADGRNRAIRTMLERVTITADHIRLPNPSEAEIDAMVSGFAIDEEYSTSTTYSAKLTYHFLRQSVRDVLIRAGIPFSDQEAAPTLLIPIYQEGETFYLWENNPHLEAWRTLRPENRLTPIVLPVGDQSDADVDPNSVLARDIDTFSGLRVRYGIQNILVALCVTDINQTRYDCSLEGGSPAGPVSEQQSYSGESQASMMAAAGAFLDVLENRWKTANISEQPGMRTGEPIEASVSFSGLREWQLLRARLVSLPQVSKVEVLGLNPRGALLTLYVSGGVVELSNALAQFGLELVEGAGIWVIRPL